MGTGVKNWFILRPWQLPDPYPEWGAPSPSNFLLAQNVGRMVRQRKGTMKFCKVGFHKWVYTSDEEGRWCEKCQKKQQLNNEGKWVEVRSVKRAEDEKKFCQCPSDYTISIRSMSCPRCGLPRRPRVLPTKNGSAYQSR